MKKVFKFTMAALAATVLASCSNDDVFSLGAEKAQMNKGDLIVEVEGLVNPVTTRSAYLPEENGTGTLYWQNGDQIRVYDETLLRYDKFFFNKRDGFTLDPEKDKSNLESVKYAVFAGGVDPDTRWDYKNNTTEVTMYIADNWTWNDKELVKVDGKTEEQVAYLSNLPLWGVAERITDESGEYKVSTKLRYLTGVLRVNLKNVPGNARTITVKGWQYRNETIPAIMTGTFTATIADENGPKDDAAFEVPDVTDTDRNTITVDISNARTDKEDAVVFIPIVAQTYGKLEVSVDDNVIFAKEDVTILRKYFYSVDVEEFEVAGATVSDINTALGLKKDKDVINITTTANTAVNSYDKDLIIPDTKADITLNLKALANVSTASLNISSVANYSGTLTINLAENISMNRINVNLPNAHVVFIGDLGQIDLGSSSWNTSKDLLVKSLTIAPTGEEDSETEVKGIYVSLDTSKGYNGDGVVLREGTKVGTLMLEKKTAVTSVVLEGELTNKFDATSEGENGVVNVKIGPKAKLVDGLVTNQEELIIEGEGVEIKNNNDTGSPSLTGKIDRLKVSGEADITWIYLHDGNEDTYYGTATLEGKATVAGIQAGEVKFAGEATGTGNVVTKTLTVGEKASVYDATVDGDVTIARTTEGEAVKNVLTMTKKASTLTLTGGYINQLATDSEAPIKIANTEGGSAPTAFHTPNGVLNSETYTSTWGGKSISKDYEGYSVSKYPLVYTASQLAPADSKKTGDFEASGAVGTVALKANIDLNNSAFTALGLNANFDGGNKTISNLSVTVAGSNAGLFGTAADGLTIKNLTINGAVVAANRKDDNDLGNNAGILVGSASGAITIDNVAVTATSVTAAENNAGGLIGSATGAVEIKNSVTNPTDKTIELGTIKAKHNLGGLVGYAGSTLSIAKAKAKITDKFDVTDAITNPSIMEMKSDDNAGSVGMYVGRTVGNLTVDAKNTSANNKINGKRKALGFTARYIVETGSDVKYYVYYGSKSGDVGICGGTYTVGTTTQGTLTANKADKEDDIKDDTYNVYLKATEYPADN